MDALNDGLKIKIIAYSDQYKVCKLLDKTTLLWLYSFPKYRMLSPVVNKSRGTKLLTKMELKKC